MPQRARRWVVPPKDDDPLVDLENLIDAMGPDAMEALARHLPAEDLADIERVMAGRHAAGWRAHPAAMAEHLNHGVDAARWPYVELLSRKFAGAFMGTANPHQQWWIPSQYGKTTGLMRGAVWALDFNPRLRIMYVSYDANKAVEEGGNARDWALEHSADLRFSLRSDRRARGLWRTDQGGGLYCVGINGGITGFPADAVLADDLLKGWPEAQSVAIRNHVMQILKAQVRMRLQGETCPFLVSGTRWHEDDHQARLLADADEHADAYQWEVIRLPAIAEAADPGAKDPLLRVPDPLGREPGDILEPERFSRAEVLARRASLGSQMWTAIEQQRPTPPEGSILKRAWWRRHVEAPPRFDELIASLDTKLKDTESGDFTCVQVWGRTGAFLWGVAQFRGQWSMDVTKVAVGVAKARYPALGRVVIEAAGYGPELKKALERPQLGYVVSPETRGLLGITDEELPAVEHVLRRGVTGVVMQKVVGGKEARAMLQVPKLEAGNVSVPAGPGWGEALIDEAAAFPLGAHDDMVDAWSQALARLDVSRVTTIARPGRSGRR